MIGESSTDLNQAAKELASFRKNGLKFRLGKLEEAFLSRGLGELGQILEDEKLTGSLLMSALLIKDASSQINEIVHAVGILKSLPSLLDSGELVESLSLGAGNTGRQFDLETNFRVAEFKFIEWKGADAVRQDSLFKDFYELAEFPTDKKKFLYVVGIDYPTKFLQGKRACKSVLTRHQKTWKHFEENYASRFTTVGYYFTHRAHSVRIVDLTELLPEMALR